MNKKSIIILTSILLLSISNNTFAADPTATTDTTTVSNDTKSTTNEKAEKIQISGIFGTRYEHTQNKGVTDFDSMVNLKITAKINDQLSVVTESEFHRNLRNDVPFDTSPDGVLHDWNWPGFQVHAKGEFDGTTVKLGRFTYMPAYGLVHGNYQEVSGGLVSFGKTVKTTIVTGENTQYWPGTSNNSTLSTADGTMQTSSYHAIDVVAPVSKITNIRASYQKGAVSIPKEALISSPELSFTEYGFDTKIGKDLSFECAQVRSTADLNNNGSYAKLTYKGANPGKLHSYDTFLTYHNLEANSIIGNDIPLDSNQKGIRYGFHYVPCLNSILTIWYDDVKELTTNTKEDKFRAQIDLFF